MLDLTDDRPSRVPRPPVLLVAAGLARSWPDAVDRAARLVRLVHDGDDAEARSALTGVQVRDLLATCVALAAMVDSTRPAGHLLAWLDDSQLDALRLAHARHVAGHDDHQTRVGERRYQTLVRRTRRARRRLAAAS